MFSRALRKIGGKVVVSGFAGVLACGVGAPRAEAVLLWGLDTGPDTLVTIDTDTSVVTTIGSLPTFGFGGLDFGADGTLYAFLGGSLYTVDTTDASTALVGVAGPLYESFEILGNTGYSARVNDESLYRIDLTDGSATLIGSHDQGAGDQRVTGLASTDGSDLYGFRHLVGDIVELSPATGGVINILGATGFVGVNNFAFGDGVFWGVPFGTDDLYSFSSVDGSATLVEGTLDINNLAGLTTRQLQKPIPMPMEVPEPASAGLVLMGLGALSGVVRRRGG